MRFSLQSENLTSKLSLKPERLRSVAVGLLAARARAQALLRAVNQELFMPVACLSLL